MTPSTEVTWDEATTIRLDEARSIESDLSLTAGCGDGPRNFYLHGKISSPKGVESAKDIVIQVNFLDAAGEPCRDICDGLILSEEIGYFFYPLQVARAGRFERFFTLRAPVASVELKVIPWRAAARGSHVLDSLELQQAEAPFAFAEHFRQSSLPRNSLAWIAGQLRNRRGPGPVSLLDLSLGTPVPEAAATVLAGILQEGDRLEAARVDSTQSRLDHRVFVDGLELRSEILSELPGLVPGRYDLICLHTPGRGLNELADLMAADLTAIMAPGATVILAVPEAAPASGSFPWTLNDFEILGVVPIAGPDRPDATGNWVILRKAGIMARLPGLGAALYGGDYEKAALILEPEFTGSAPNPLLIEKIRPLSGKFAELAAGQAKQNHHDRAAISRLIAAELDPGNESLACEAMAALRVRNDLALTERLYDRVLKIHPNSWGVRLQGAFLYSMTGRGDRAIEILSDYVRSIRGTFNPSMRRTISTIMRSYAHECQRAGMETDNAQPLLVPEVAMAYNADHEKHAARWFASPLTDLLVHDARDRAHLRARARAAAPAPAASRRTRMLVLSAGSWRFIVKQLRYMEGQQTDFELRSYDFSFQEEEIRKKNLHEIFAPVSLDCPPAAVWAKACKEDGALKRLVEWADVIYCEWAGLPAIWLSRFLPPEKRLIVRLHSYEAFSQWPFFINWGGVDGMIFVADHIRRFADLQFRISDHPVATTVLPNFNDLSAYERPKKPGAERTVVMLGYNNRNKDPLMAVKVVEVLRRSDPSWRLKLVGHGWNPATMPPEEAAYHETFMAYIRDNGLEEMIEFTPFTHDVPGVLQEAGFMISCSWREGTHEAILEGMASGAVPVIRRWPMVSAYGAPETTYPELDYFDTAEEAAAEILGHAGTAAFAEASRRARDYVRARFTQDVVYPQFAEFVRKTIGSEVQ